MATVEERISALETNTSSIFHQIGEMKEDIRNITRLTIAVEKIANKVDNIDEKVNRIDERLTTVEQEPAEEYKHIRRTIISAVISTIVGAVIGALITLLTI